MDPREALLDSPHLRPLMALVADLRARGLEAPNFDPLDGGIKASVAFLLESPGPKAVGTKYISRDNPDPSARNMASALYECGISRSETVLWNVVPYCVSTIEANRNASSKQIREAIPYTQPFLDALPKLRAVVFCGRKAQLSARLLNFSENQKIFSTFHPGARSFNQRRCREHIYATFSDVCNFLKTKEPPVL